MVGEYHITVSNRHLKYDFTIRRNITVIKGNSASGKTTLIEMIREYNEQEDSGIDVHSEKPCVVVYGKNWKRQLSMITDSIVFIDESGRFTKSKEFAVAIQGSDNYYVIISREKLDNLPFSIQEIYGIRESGKYNTLKAEYTLNEFYNIYAKQPTQKFLPEVIITEDSNSGYDFWENICKLYGVYCESAGGKSGIIKKVKDSNFKGKKRLAIVDGAAFGAEMEMLMQYICYEDSLVELYAPESFEYLILSSDLFSSSRIEQYLQATYNYADSIDFFSWERFYTKLLMDETQGTERQYKKSRLNSYYFSEKIQKTIMKEIPKVLQEKFVKE